MSFKKSFLRIAVQNTKNRLRNKILSIPKSLYKKYQVARILQESYTCPKQTLNPKYMDKGNTFTICIKKRKPCS